MGILSVVKNWSFFVGLILFAVTSSSFASSDSSLKSKPANCRDQITIVQFYDAIGELIGENFTCTLRHGPVVEKNISATIR